MGILALKADERVKNLRIDEDVISVDLRDGRRISVPLIWYPRLANASQQARENWQTSGGGYGICC